MTRDRSARFRDWDRSVDQSIQDEAEALTGLDTALRLRRQDRDHIPASAILPVLPVWSTCEHLRLQQSPTCSQHISSTCLSEQHNNEFMAQSFIHDWVSWTTADSVSCGSHKKVKKKVKEADFYSAFIEIPYTQGAQVRITQCYLQTTPYLPLPRKHSPDGASQTEVADI